MSHNRKSLGAYYTPSYVSLPITKWAVREANDIVMDPTFGGCSFIEHAIKVLSSVGNKSPHKSIYGTDVDPTAFEHLGKILPKSKQINFSDTDFFDVDFSEKFDAIIGNPPYIKHDNIPNNSLIRARSSISDSEILKNLIRPNYWVYFILRSLKILNLGGRIGFVLPHNFIKSKYSGLLQNYLKSYFVSIDIIPIIDSIFEYTNESTVVVLMDDFSNKKIDGSITMHDPVLGKDVGKAIQRISSMRKNNQSFKTLNTEQEAQLLLNNIGYKYKIYELSRYFVVKIGIVTGSKDFFVLDNISSKTLNIEREFLKPVVSRSVELNSLILDESFSIENHLLVIPSNIDGEEINKYSFLKAYIDAAPESASESVHAKNRSPWYSLKRVFTSHGFIKNVVKGNVFIYTNNADLLCTNNILRLNLLSDYDLPSLSVFSTTSLFQLSALVNSIKYGKGSMKLEPLGITKMLLPYKKLERYLIEYILKETNDLERYDQDKIDKILLGTSLGISEKEIKLIQDMLKSLRVSRNISTHRKEIT